jgi:hypothetical protein
VDTFLDPDGVEIMIPEFRMGYGSFRDVAILKFSVKSSFPGEGEISEYIGKKIISEFVNNDFTNAGKCCII